MEKRRKNVGKGVSMDRDKVREEIAIIIHGGFRSDVKAGAMADDVLSLLAPVFEKAEKYEKAAKGLKAVEDLMNNSEGVMGLHLNGDIAPWSELRTEGRFEEWLVAFDEAISEVPDGN